MFQQDYSNVALPLSSAERGLGAMVQPNQGRPNMDDMGVASDPRMGGQEMITGQLAMQAARANTETQIPQQIAGAQGQMRKIVNEAENAAFDAEQFKFQKMEQLADAMGGGQALMPHVAMFDQLINGPDGERMRDGIRADKIQFGRMA